jgi:hypothetical protein
MTASLSIDASTGDVVVNGFVITKRTTPQDLPDGFSVGLESEVFVIREKVPCLFAHATVDDSREELQIDLRFERRILVSVFFRLPNATEAAHLEWFKKKLGGQQGRSYSRGSSRPSSRCSSRSSSRTTAKNSVNQRDALKRSGGRPTGR